MRKFQTLNSSCAYTGIANLLAQYQIDTEDKNIIIGSNAAFQLLYDKQKNTFLAGCRIQGKKWFNYYLNTIGFSFNEIETGIEDYIFSLKNNAPAHIIGFYLGNNEKHTVVYEGIENNLYKYLNNQQPRRRASGYVVLIRWLQSALIPFVTTQSVAEKRQVLNPPHE